MHTKKAIIVLTSVLLLTGCHSLQRRITKMSMVQPKLHQPTPIAQLLATNILQLINSAKALQATNNPQSALEGLIASAEALHNRKISSSRQPANTDEVVDRLIQSTIALQSLTNTLGQSNSLPQLSKFVTSLSEYLGSTPKQKPIAQLLSEVMTAVNDSRSETNSQSALQRMIQSTEELHSRLPKSSTSNNAFLVSNLITAGLTFEQVTNPATNAALFVTSVFNYLDSLTNGGAPISAFLQIASDADAAQEFGQTFSRCFYVGELVIQNSNTDSFLAYSSSLQMDVTYYAAESDWLAVRTNMLARFKKEYIVDKRRPSTYSDILAIFEYQRQANGRQQFVNYLQSAGEIAAGATIFVGGKLYPKAVAFATGIVEKEIQKRLLWDILLHAKNLEARSLKEVEEIPGRASIHRVVFFPKRGIPGILDDHLVYISSFKPWESITISGSIIEKKQSVTTGQ